MREIQYYVERGSQGDASAALTAAKLMTLEGYNDLMIQHQLRHAASRGSVEAMRWLGLLGLVGRLLTRDSTIGQKRYETSPAAALSYLRGAARCGDVFSRALIARYRKCDCVALALPEDALSSLLVVTDALLSPTLPDDTKQTASD